MAARLLSLGGAPAAEVIESEEWQPLQEQGKQSESSVAAVLPTLSRVQETLSVPNEVAAELAGVGDGVLDALRARLACTLRLRGNQLTIEGEDQNVAAARAVVDELVELVEGGHEIGPDTVGAVVAALDQAEDIREVFDDVV